MRSHTAGTNAYYEGRASTDSLAGVAWVSPTDYVVPMTQRAHQADYSLRLFRQGCEMYGSKLVYRGSAVDPGLGPQFWPILPAGRSRVLVMTRVELRKARRHQEAHWSVVDTSNGHLSTTKLTWTRGAWERVEPERFVSPDAPVSCKRVKWIWP